MKKKLTDDDVREIRRLYKASQDAHQTFRSLGERFGIHHTYVRNLVLGHKWKRIRVK